MHAVVTLTLLTRPVHVCVMRADLQLFAIVPIGGQLSSQLGSLLAGPSIVPEAEMLGMGPEMYNCMGCECPAHRVHTRPCPPSRPCLYPWRWRCCVHDVWSAVVCTQASRTRRATSAAIRAPRASRLAVRRVSWLFRVCGVAGGVYIYTRSRTCCRVALQDHTHTHTQCTFCVTSR